MLLVLSMDRINSTRLQNRYIFIKNQLKKKNKYNWNFNRKFFLFYCCCCLFLGTFFIRRRFAAYLKQKKVIRYPVSSSRYIVRQPFALKEWWFQISHFKCNVLVDQLHHFSHSFSTSLSKLMKIHVPNLIDLKKITRKLIS